MGSEFGLEDDDYKPYYKMTKSELIDNIKKLNIIGFKYDMETTKKTLIDRIILYNKVKDFK